MFILNCYWPYSRFFWGLGFGWGAGFRNQFASNAYFNLGDGIRSGIPNGTLGYRELNTLNHVAPNSVNLAVQANYGWLSRLNGIPGLQRDEFTYGRALFGGGIYG